MLGTQQSLQTSSASVKGMEPGTFIKRTSPPHPILARKVELGVGSLCGSRVMTHVRQLLTILMIKSIKNFESFLLMARPKAGLSL